MEGEDGGDMPPFWLQNNSSNYNRNRRRSSSSNFLLNSGFLIIILMIVALFLIFIVVPSFLSFTSQYIKPHLIKKNWDSLNIVLVFFAIICGFLSRRTADDIPGVAGDGFSNLSSQPALVEEDKPNQMHHHHHQHHLRHRPMSMDQPWIGYSNMNPVMYNSMDNLSSLSSTTSNVRGMRRNSSSYPDLRQESLWNPAPESRRFYDDNNVDGYQYGGAPDYLHRRHPSDPLPAPVPTEYQYNESNYLLHHNSAPVPSTVPESDDTKYFSDTKNIPVDTFVVRQPEESSPEHPPVTEPSEQPSPPSPNTPPPAPPPPAAETRRKERAERRTFRSVDRREKPVEEKKEMEFEKVRAQILISPPPPPLPPQSAQPSKSENKSNKGEKKRSSNAATDIKNTFASLYNQRKNKKKNKQKSKESFDDMFHQLFDEPAVAQSFVGLPPPPPPPPPSSVFHQLFKKSSKTKKIHSDSAPPPLPPPPPTKPFRSSKRRVQNQDPSSSIPENSSPPKQVWSPPKPESSRRKKPSTPGKPPLPASPSSHTYFPSDELYSNSGNQSPLIPMPPPPPPPPFKMSAMKFVVRGDFVRIRSRTSRSGSPELLDDAPSAQESQMDTPISTQRVMDSTDGESSIPSSPFCPSPDVDYKADSFIARFRAGLKNGN